ncbi:NAD(P)-binding domain-containing protein [Nocardia sp. NPDC059239]|uniref:NAD(P)-binding domain-containing protein n=1 Tax=Nocardia sp. NPDC059239 TaxID=3346785 RepID=UPI00369756F8
MTSRPPLYLDKKTVAACLSEREIYDTVSETLYGLSSGSLVNGPKFGFGVDMDATHVHMGGVSGCITSSSVAGIKWFTVAHENPSRNLPRVPATILVCNAETGLLEGVLDGTQLTSNRTAAMAIVAASACLRGQAKRMAVVGAGAIGRALVKLLVMTQQVEHVYVAARRESAARAACDLAAGSVRGQTTLTATSDVPQAVRDADVIFTATGVSEDTDLVQSAWLKDGAIVCSLAGQREVDLELISQAWIVADDIQGLRTRRHDFREGGTGFDRIAADVGSVISGHARPPDNAKRIHLALVGLGVLDVALGWQAIDHARRRGLGLALESPQE